MRHDTTLPLILYTMAIDGLWLRKIAIPDE